MDLVFNKSTDSKHKITLESKLIYAEWRGNSAPIGQTSGFEVGTCFVGHGAAIEVKGKSQKGKNLGTVKGKVIGNKFTGEFTIPADTKLGDMVYFEVKIPKNNITGESNRIPAVPPIKAYDLHWSASEARRGDVLTLSATTENIPDDAPVKVIIYEYDDDGAHDNIAEIPTTIKRDKIELSWEYEYHEDTDEIPTDAQMSRYGRSYNPPEYFFAVKVADQEFGKSDQASGLLEFKDYLEIELKDKQGNIMANEDYVLTLPDGSERKGKLDENGRAREDNIPPGNVTVVFPNIQGAQLAQ